MAFQNSAFQNDAFQIARQDDGADWLRREEKEQAEKRAKFRIKQRAEALALELYQKEIEQLRQGEIDMIEMLIALMLIEESSNGHL
jgi:hypothetical protein